MARCEDCLHYNLCVDIETRHLKIILIGDKAERCKQFTPTADVVPKSEVDLYRKQVDELEDELASTYDKLETAKTDVARTFRKRMNEKMGKHTHLLVKEYVQRILREVEKEMVGDNAELKKKYTEGE